ncbi:MAG TPA: hypothetical protein VII19_06705, partial [Acidimicrobiales bacterium]
PPPFSTLDLTELGLLEFFQQLYEPATAFDRRPVTLSLLARQPPGDPLAALAVSPLDIGTMKLRGLLVAAAVLLAAPRHPLN